MQDNRGTSARERQASALDELAHDTASRQRFLKVMGGAGAAGALGTLLAACGGTRSTQAGTTQATTSSPSARSDLKILQYALTLEHVEADFYSKVLGSGLFKGKALDLLKTINQHEHDHVQTVTATIKKLGGAPAAKPNTRFPLTDARTVLNLASVFENLGAAAYLGQAPKIKSPEVLAAALSIHTVEARHAAALNTMVHKPVTPEGAFAKPASMADVLPKVKPFIAGTTVPRGD